jgi:hypothetical protein
MKKLGILALAACFACVSTSAFAETSHDKHKVHTKSHHGKAHIKEVHKKGVRTKATTPGMPKTGLGGASE